MSQYNQDQYFMLNSKFLFSAFLDMRMIHQQDQFVTLNTIQQQLYTRQKKTSHLKSLMLNLIQLREKNS